ncbi:hypothetical protein [Pediococcus acidilactici]|uniref:hypothetical protein n=1 Tax=Pediococcus acidilactici TaxID=1254 RepID=UPI0013288DCD|nr:hypothetical protein [Pediococcus acidilactici]KAF0337617.1 hypothetical protein GBO39_04380 [Pediococcus acidilactici]KAF0348158.1 hypothetical protein GBO45_08970 [Pediococcus acidilactici]KAF0463443.1 hypothetical protein GBP03_04385 [Pediococcus acidilactici]KAF0502453.1 hypothetical protein GBP23_08975 [Pediococcus acidilactici]KAF0511858.1 hypothetical protein GBP28_08975 [Pediococcus acidilactici]
MGNKNVGLINYIIILLAITISFNSFWAITSAFTGMVRISNNIALLALITVIFIDIVNEQIRNKIFFNYRRMLLSILFLIFIVLLFVMNFIVNGTLTIGSDIATYGWLIPIILLVNMIRSADINVKRIECFLLWMVVPQLFLGMLQHYIKRTFVPIISGGKTIVNTIFFLNGASSNDPNYLNYGAQIRAFGMTDSGLTLGVWALLVFSISLFSKRFTKKVRVFLFIFSGIAAFATLTRNIYIACLFLLFFKILLTRFKISKHLLNVVFIVLFFFSFIGVYISSFLYVINNYVSSFGITTFGVRFQYLHSVLQRLSDTSSIMFGLQIKPNINNPIDNGIIALLVDKGVLLTAAIVLLFIYIYIKYINNGDNVFINDGTDLSFSSFFLTFPIVSFANNVTTTYGYILIIAIMLFNNNRNKL